MYKTEAGFAADSPQGRQIDDMIIRHNHEMRRAAGLVEVLGSSSEAKCRAAEIMKLATPGNEEHPPSGNQIDAVVGKFLKEIKPEVDKYQQSWWKRRIG